jgi:hypothetical protein
MQVRDKKLQEALWSEDCAEQIEAVQNVARQRRADLLPDLIRLLPSDHVGYFVEEVLPSFGEVVRRPLLGLLRDNDFPLPGRRRAAGVLAALGEYEAVPILVEAIGQWNVNQAYFTRLARLDPTALKKRLRDLITAQEREMHLETDPLRADYFSKLILALHDVDGQQEFAQLLESLQVKAKDWRVRAAAEVALAG